MASAFSPSARPGGPFAHGPRLMFVALSLAPLSPARVGAQAGEDTTVSQSITFVHAGCHVEGSECRLSYALTLAQGERFAVRITETPLTLFEYSVAGIPRAAPGEAPHAEAAELGDTTLFVTHDQRFGGYIVSLRRKPDEKGAAGYPEATLLVSVETERWQYEVGGGFPVSTLLNDRVYELRDTAIGDQSRSLVARDRGKESRVRLHTATFVHLFRTDSRLAWSFGLGIGDETAYFLGASYRFGSAGALTLGGVFSSYQDLPKGIRVGDITDDANALANPGTRTSAGLFVGFSFGFLGSDRSALDKPFKGEVPPLTQPVGGQSVPAPRSAVPTADAPNTLTVSDSVLSPGDSVTITVTLVAPEGEVLAAETYQVMMESPFDTTPIQVQFSPVQGGKRLEGRFATHVADDAQSGALPASLTLDGGGMSTPLRIAGDAVRVQRRDPGGSALGG